MLKSSPKVINGFTDEVTSRFESYNWPGNVRELENIVERAVTLAKGSNLTIAELPPEMQSSNNKIFSFDKLSFSEAKQQMIEDIEKKYLLFLLRKYNGHVTKMAEEADMTRRNIHRLLKRHDIDPNAWR